MVPVLLAAVLYILAMVVLYGLVSAIRDAFASRSWPEADGVVMESELVSARRTGGRHGRGYSLRFRYRFEVDGIPVVGARIAPCRFTGGTGAAARAYFKRIIEKYPEGARVRVRYSPRNPKRCCLEPGIGSMPAFCLGLFAFLCFFGTATLVAWKTVF